MQVKLLMGCAFLSVARLYFVAVNATPIDDPKPVTEGDNVTLCSGVDNTMDVIISDEDDNRLLYLEAGNINNKTDNIAVEMKTGSIILLRVQKKDPKVYKVQMLYTNGTTTTSFIRLNVTERQHHINENLTLTPQPVDSAQPTRNHIAAYVSVPVFAVLVLGLLAFSCKRRTDSPATSTQRSTGPSCCVNVAEDGSSASSSRSGSVGEKEQEKLMEKKVKG